MAGDDSWQLLPIVERKDSYTMTELFVQHTARQLKGQKVHLPLLHFREECCS